MSKEAWKKFTASEIILYNLEKLNIKVFSKIIILLFVKISLNFLESMQF